MTIGIIGSGAIGAAIAKNLARAGIEATISNSRGPDSPKDLIQELGPAIKACTREETELYWFGKAPSFDPRPPC